MTLTMTKKDQIMNLLMKARKKIQYISIVVMGFLMECLQTVPVYAGGTITNPDKIDMNKSADADTVFGKTVGLVLGLIKYAGLIMAVFGFIKLIIAWNNDQADQIKSAAMMIISGIVMFFLKDVLKGVGLTA